MSIFSQALSTLVAVAILLCVCGTSTGLADPCSKFMQKPLDLQLGQANGVPGPVELSIHYSASSGLQVVNDGEVVKVVGFANSKVWPAIRFSLHLRVAAGQIPHD